MKEAKEVYEEFVHALSESDAEAVAELLAPREDIVGIGSDPGEFWTGHAKLAAVWKAQLDELGKISVESDPPAGGATWAAAQIRLTLPDGPTIAGRMSIVTEDDKIVHFHFSVPVSNQEALGQELTT